MAQNTSRLADLNPAQRATIAIGVVALLGVSLAAYLWLHRVNFQPIYENLNEGDAAAVITQLQEMKVPYELADGGRTVLVDSGQLEEARVLMDGGKLAIRGGEGFELFDNMDYGMTEFAQKINYKRALQGEISRTLIGLQEVRYARVHLVMPEKSLFQQADAKPKASITIVQEPGQTISAAQIQGIQELVASAIEGMEPQQVTLLNENGMVLSQSQYQDDHGMASRLGQKQQLEHYLGSKTESILSQLFGPGKSVVNIDVSLSYDQVQLTREIYSPGRKDAETGILERSRVQRQYRDQGAGTETRKVDNPLYSETTEYDYKVGKSVEQVVKGAGEVERLTVSVVVPDTTTDETIIALEQLVANAVGLRLERGDSIEIFALPLTDIVRMQMDMGTVSPDTVKVDLNESTAETRQVTTVPLEMKNPYVIYAVLGLLVALALVAMPFVVGGRKNGGVRSLTDVERRALLADVQAWMEEDQAPKPAEES